MTLEEVYDKERFRDLQEMATRRKLTLKKQKGFFGVVNWPRGSAGTAFYCNDEADVYRAMSLMMQVRTKL